MAEGDSVCIPSDTISNSSDGSKSILTVCPHCKGKGFVAGLADRKGATPSVPMPLALPKIRSPMKDRWWRTQKLSEDFPVLPSKPHLQGGTGRPDRSRQLDRLPPIRRSRSVASSSGSSTAEVIPEVEIFDLAEFVRQAKVKLKSRNLDEMSSGVLDVVYISRVDENTANSLLPTVTRRQSYVTRPEFDEMLILLLKRTGDAKKVVREEATEALNVLVAGSPPTFTIRALCMRGPESKTTALRCTSARIITSCINQVGREQLISNPSLRDMRRRVLESGCKLLLDPLSEVRTLAKGFMLELREVDGFDEALEADAPDQLLNEVERTMLWLRHASDPPSNRRPCSSISSEPKKRLK